MNSRSCNHLPNLRILLVTYNWPPRNAIGTQRPLSWARFWHDQGVYVEVLTSRKCAFDAPLDLVVEPLPGLVVNEIEFSLGAGSSQLRLGDFCFAGLKSIAKKAKGIASNVLGRGIDPRDGWFLAARSTVLEMADRFDVVVSTFGPRACHMIAALMKQKNPRLVWVADYRDLWSQNHLLGLGVRAKRHEAKLERDTVGRYADALTTVSPELAGQLSEAWGKPVRVIFNGFDADEQELRHCLRAVGMRRPRGRPIRIVYTGSIYPGRRDPSPLFRSLARLLRSGWLSSADIRVEFYGPDQAGLLSLASTAGVFDVVHACGQVDRDHALRVQREADLLLLLESGEEDAKGVLTGKLFEYMSAGVPIISLGSRQGSAIARVLDETGAGFCLGEDENAIGAFLERIVSEALVYKPAVEKILYYSRRTQAQLMLDAVRDVHQGLLK